MPYTPIIIHMNQYYSHPEVDQHKFVSIYLIQQATPCYASVRFKDSSLSKGPGL